LAEALRRCVRTSRALRAAVGVLRDCLRSAPDDAACRAQLRDDRRLLQLSDEADVMERQGNWSGAAETLRAFAAADVRGLFRVETHTGLCRVESRAARVAHETAGGGFGPGGGVFVGFGGAGGGVGGGGAGAWAYTFHNVPSIYTVLSPGYHRCERRKYPNRAPVKQTHITRSAVDVSPSTVAV